MLDDQPYEVLEANPMKKAQRRVVIQAKIRNILTDSVVDRNFHQGDTFEEAELQKFNATYLYTHKDSFFFCDSGDPAKRFELTKEQIGDKSQYLKQNQIVEGVMFQDKVITVNLPIKIQLRVTDSPPGIRGDRAQGGTKQAILETGAISNVPLFVKIGDIIEINTETGEYVRRVE